MGPRLATTTQARYKAQLRCVRKLVCKDDLVMRSRVDLRRSLFPDRVGPRKAAPGADVARATRDDHPEVFMPRTCQVTGKRTRAGQNVSHANNKTKRQFRPNLHERRFWVASENRWVRLRISMSALRTIDKNGIDAVLAELRARGDKV